MGIIRQKLIIAIAGAVAVFALLIYLILYVPLMKQLKVRYSECRTIETKVTEARDYIKSVEVETKSAILTEEDISLTIDELTKRGRSRGISFISMIPKEIEREKAAYYGIMPIEMEIESAYEDVVSFMGSLDELERSLVTVRNFKMKPDKAYPKKIVTELVVNMYLLGR